jgi:hypothetical protein
MLEASTTTSPSARIGRDDPVDASSEPGGSDVPSGPTRVPLTPTSEPRARVSSAPRASAARISARSASASADSEPAPMRSTYAEMMLKTALISSAMRVTSPPTAAGSTSRALRPS